MIALADWYRNRLEIEAKLRTAALVLFHPEDVAQALPILIALGYRGPARSERRILERGRFYVIDRAGAR